MKFLIGTFLIVAILFMCVFIFIGIWLFVIALKSHSQLRYHNYILEKICGKLTILSDKLTLNDFKINNSDYINDDNNFFEVNSDINPEVNSEVNSEINSVVNSDINKDKFSNTASSNSSKK